LSHQRQAELTELLDRLAAIQDISEHDGRLRHLHFDWIDAGERTQATVRLLSEQLRRFLDDQVWLESRRVFDLLRSIESQAVALRQHPPPLEMELDDMAATITLAFERPLYAPQQAARLSDEAVVVGSDDFDASALLDQMHVDREELAQTVRDVLRNRSQVALAPVVAEHPFSQGLAELVGYLSLSDPSFEVIFDETGHEEITWEADSGTMIADGPAVNFARRTAGAR
jgi:Protein of unknown function (DUF3375)